MKKYLYLIKKAKIKSWLKFWLLSKDQVKYILSEILEGFSFNLQNTVKRYFKIFNIFGNSVQDGTPTPTNPVPIESVADDVNFALITSTSSTIYNSILKNGEITINGTSTSATNVVVYLNNQTDLILEANKTYTISVIFTGEISGDTYKAIYLLFGDNAVLIGSIESNTTKVYTYTPTVDTIFKFVNFDLGANNTFNNMKVQIKVQKGTVATPYSPYNYGTFTIDFEGQTENYNYTFITKPLRSLPNGVRDSLEDDGIHRRVGRIVLNGSENWGTVGNDRYYIAISNKRSVSEYIKSGLSSNYFQSMKYTGGIPNIGYISENYYKGGNINVFFNYNGSNNDLAGFKTWLSTHNTEVLYELAEEVIEPYTEEQQEQYNKIKELYTFDGTTNIYSTDEVPPYLQIQYYMKGE